MKNYVFLLSVFMAGQTQARSFVHPPHMDLEMSTQEYRAILKLQTQKQSFNKTLKVMADDPEIALAIQLGERLSKWINLVNTGRTPETAIRLTSKLTRRAITIENPNRYNTPIIKADTDKALTELPAPMKEVLLSSASLPPTIPVDDVTFIKHARVVDFNYQSACLLYTSPSPRDGLLSR